MVIDSLRTHGLTSPVGYGDERIIKTTQGLNTGYYKPPVFCSTPIHVSNGSRYHRTPPPLAVGTAMLHCHVFCQLTGRLLPVPGRSGDEV